MFGSHDSLVMRYSLTFVMDMHLLDLVLSLRLNLGYMLTLKKRR